MSKQIGYIRVSSIDQNPERQLEGLQLDRIFIDKASGKDTNRPELQALLDYVRDGDTVIIHSMDRLARNLVNLQQLVNKLTAGQVKIHFLKENLIFTGDDSPMSKLLLSMVGAVAEFERALIKERQLEGVAIDKSKGVYKGRKKVLNDEKMQEIKSLLAQGKKKSAVARQFSISRETLYQYLK